MDTDASVKSSRLEQPQVLTLVLRWTDREGRSERFVVVLLNGLQLGVKLGWSERYMLFKHRNDV